MSVISRCSTTTIDTGRLTALNSISSRLRDNTSAKLETEEERFSRKLKQMSILEREMEVCKGKLKETRNQHEKLEAWIKSKMHKKAITDGTNKVEVMGDNKVYTFERKKEYKNKAPGKKDIKRLIQAFFDETDLAEFMAYSSRVKAATIFDRIYTVGTSERSSFRKRSVIRTPRSK
uniref:Uncharacterized protein n=1 Tax=viral metagenome TaxID=1070528 RepID=A0A6C0F8V7_9ZZZZ|tara:strand:+ start:39137 stop:39664 length:528 start_codon:yes stop_codon:yes gene_type:complete